MKIHGVNKAIFVICLVFSQHIDLAAAANLQQEPTSDIRILIDVSGSMKWNDPQNLRAPALRLVTSLLPKGSHAGVWTFGKFVNMLVPYGEVDNAWKQQAKQAATQIHSRGLFTNIEGTLETATWNWKEPDDNIQRSIILLTDGLVDISKDVAENEHSRSHILDSILPRIQKSDGTIYTIALSDEADDVLLQQLAAATNGWSEQADTADALERIFFRMFEKAANPDTLPLVDNTVLVDESIAELTMLVFRKDGAAPSQLVTPDNQTFGEDTAPDNVNWNHEERYDLITISKPASGSWHVNADVDPDNRVMVVTNLRMITTTLPNNISLGDDYTYYVSLTQDDKIIEKKEFLHFIKASLTQQSNDKQWEWMLLDNGRDADEIAGDGVYAIHLDKTLLEGEHTLTINVDGTTFKRTHRQVINIYDSPVLASITPTEETATSGFTLSITPRAGMIDPETINITAVITDKDNNANTLTVPRINNSEWRLSLDDYSHNKRYSARIEISGERSNGKPVNVLAGPLNFGTEVVKSVENIANNATENNAAHDNTVDEQKMAVPEMDISINWLNVFAQVIVFNIIFAIGIFFGIKAWRKSTKIMPIPWDNLVHE